MVSGSLLPLLPLLTAYRFTAEVLEEALWVGLMPPPLTSPIREWMALVSMVPRSRQLTGRGKSSQGQQLGPPRAFTS